MVENRKPGVDSHKCAQLIFDKGTKTFNGGKIVFSRNKWF
jgi:hypothetical protein